MAEIRIYGYSDDLIEIEGSIEDEIPFENDPTLIALSTGTIIQIQHGVGSYSELYWTLIPVKLGTAIVSRKVFELSENEYSDVLTITGDIEWLAVIEKHLTINKTKV